MQQFKNATASELEELYDSFEQAYKDVYDISLIEIGYSRITQGLNHGYQTPDGVAFYVAQIINSAFASFCLGRGFLVIDNRD